MSARAAAAENRVEQRAGGRDALDAAGRNLF